MGRFSPMLECARSDIKEELAIIRGIKDANSISNNEEVTLREAEDILESDRFPEDPFEFIT